MRVVHLDRHLLGERVPVGVAALLEARQDVLHGRRAQHVLLAQAQRLALARAVAGVEHRAQLLREVGLRHGRLVVAGVEGGEVEILGRHLGVPQAQRDAVLGLVPGDGRVVRHGVDGLAGRPHAVHHLAVEGNLVRGGALHLPRVTHLEPVVGVLHLLARLRVDALLEKAVLVAQAVAPGGQVQRGDGVQEARGEAPEAAVTEAHVLLDGGAGLEVVPQRAERVRVLAGQTQVADGVGERAALQVLHRDVVRLLGVRRVEVRVGGVPVLHELLAHGLRGRTVHVVRLELERHRAHLAGLVHDVGRDGLRGLRAQGGLERGGIGGDVCRGKGARRVGRVGVSEASGVRVSCTAARPRGGHAADPASPRRRRLRCRSRLTLPDA